MRLTLASLAHSHGHDEAGRECDILVITYTKWLRARAAHNMGNLWQCCNVHKKPPSIGPSLPPSVDACLPAGRPTDRSTNLLTYLYLQYHLPGGSLLACLPAPPPPTYLPTYLPASLPACLPAYLPTYLRIYLPLPTYHVDQWKLYGLPFQEYQHAYTSASPW